MAAASAEHTDHGELTKTSALLSKRNRLRRPPMMADYILFFLGIPLLIAFLFSLVGTRLTNGMPYLDSLLYLNIHMITAWWPVCAGAFFIKFCFRSWQPPLIAVCMLGLLLAIIPAAYLFQTLGDWYANLYPIFAANRSDHALPSWDLEYLLHFIRYSVPVVPLFLGGVYSYRSATGVDWFGYGDYDEQPVNGTPSVVEAPKTTPAIAGLIDGCKLDKDAEILAIKAEQHYIQIWTEAGTELVRYRFRDLAETLGDCNGAQVHRSWWVNLEKVQSYKQDGRKMELTIDDELKVPVSLSYKNVVLGALDRPQ